MKSDERRNNKTATHVGQCRTGGERTLFMNILKIKLSVCVNRGSFSQPPKTDVDVILKSQQRTC